VEAKRDIRCLTSTNIYKWDSDAMTQSFPVPAVMEDAGDWNLSPCTHVKDMSATEGKKVGIAHRDIPGSGSSSLQRQDIRAIDLNSDQAACDHGVRRAAFGHCSFFVRVERKALVDVTRQELTVTEPQLQSAVLHLHCMPPSTYVKAQSTYVVVRGRS
jgi:hypothetical protein